MDILNTKIKNILTEKNTKIRPENIKSGVNILGINGNVTALNGETKTVTPTTSQQTITPSSGKNAITQVTVNAVTSAIDNNIQAENIKDGVSILGIAGTYTGETPNLQSKSVTITENGTQTITADSGYDGLDEVEVTTNVSGGASEYNAKVVTTPISTAYTSYPNAIRFIKEFPAIDLTGFTSCQSFFNNCNNLEKVEVFDTSNVTTFEGMFKACKKIKTIPQFDTSKVTNFKNFCNDCNLLENVPILDTHVASPYSMSGMFQLCSNLTNESLNNILYMCAHVGSGSAYRTLAYIGLTSAQATTCTGLSNWSAAQSAGWTTGY